MKVFVAAAAAGFTFGVASPASAAEALKLPEFLDNEYYKLVLNVRTRLELAEADNLDDSQALTVRTRAGIQLKPWNGLSAYGDIDYIVALNNNDFFDVVENPTGQTPIADPEEFELNQLYLDYSNKDAGNFQLRVGRQRIKLDDDRWIGNVGWRQNEQTFDAALIASSLGIKGMKAQYAYLDEIHRIFGNEKRGPAPNFESNSHILHVDFPPIEALNGMKVAAFGYWLDFSNAAVNSSNTYGFRATGGVPMGDPFKFSYVVSYALQTDAANNPVDYTAHYAYVEPTLRHSSLGGLGLGYELLGSDDGAARVVTPLSTAHKFNGFADVFLDNGGTNGLQDLFVTYYPPIPLKNFKGKIIYHKFISDEGSDELGDEINFVATYPFTPNFSVLTKGAYFFAEDDSGLEDIWRFWLDFTFKI